MIKACDFTLYFSGTFFMVIKYRIILLKYSKISCVYFIVDSHPVMIIIWAWGSVVVKALRY
jgi:hypothetical protein